MTKQRKLVYDVLLEERDHPTATEVFIPLQTEYFALQGAPSDVILETVREYGADLVVMGTHGHSGLAHVLLGSVAERVVRTAPCPVLTVKPPDAG